MLCGISEVKMAVLSNVVERGKQKFDDTGIKKSWRWEWTEKVVSGEKLSLFMRKILSLGVAYCNLCHQEVNYSSCRKVDRRPCNDSEVQEHTQNRLTTKKTKQSSISCFFTAK